MLIKNTFNRYGTLSKIFHWGIVVLFLIQFYLIFWKRYMLPENSPLAGYYINGLHKPIGILTLIFVLLAILWKLINVKPTFPFNMTLWEKFAARSVHLLLYASMLIMPLSGIGMTEAAGRPLNFFGWYEIPQFIEMNKNLSQFLFEIHETTAFIIIALVTVHILAALKHHFINRDTVLKRIL